MLDLWLVRHAESVGNVEGTDADTTLSPRGITEAHALGRALDRRAFEAVWTSPLRRARETALGALPHVEARIDARLTEFVPPPTTRVLDTASMGPAEIAAFLASAGDAGGESGAAFKARVGRFRADLPTMMCE